MGKHEQELYSVLNKIGPPDSEAQESAKQHWLTLAKPLGSLGTLEEDISRVTALTGNLKVDFRHRMLYVLCADNGVVAQGVTQAGSEVTGIVADELAAKRTAVCQMAAVAQCDVKPVDMGIHNYPGNRDVLSCRIGNGTSDISRGPAMTREQAALAVLTGINLVKKAREQGVTLLASGEMGIGNTTTSSAIATVLLNRAPEDLTGKGAGLSDEGLKRKISVVRSSIAVNQPDAEDILDVLSKVGGFDLAGLCGLFLGGAYYKIPVLMDGVITNVAALCAARLCPNARKAVFASHRSKEPAAGLILKELNLNPVLDAGMFLGEGAGAVAAVPLLDMAQAVYSDSYTFAEGGIEPYQPC